MQARESPLSRRTSERTPPRSKRGAIAEPASRLRILHLLFTPAAVRFLSCEPMLGPVPRPLPSWMGTGPDFVGDFCRSPKAALGDRRQREWPRSTRDAPRLDTPHC